jgi:formylglycine-generating enzyme required for sulfatase activity
MAFCRWLAGHSGRDVVLPSEAQWELAARGEGGGLFPWGEEEPDNSRACFGLKWETGQPAPVGSFPAGRGPYNHLDLAGNVWEWCLDVWDEEAYRERAGSEPRDPVVEEGDKDWRVLRGGGWSNPAENLRSAIRFRDPAANRNRHIGFRVAVVPSSLDS